MGGAFRHRISSGGGGRQRQNATVAMDWRWECVFVLSTKFRFTHRHSRSGSNKVSVPNQYLEIKTEWSAPVHLFRCVQEIARPACSDHIHRVGRTTIRLCSFPLSIAPSVA